MVRVLRVWIVAVVLMVPQSVLACAVCLGGEVDNRQAFIDTTVILTVASLIIVGLFNMALSHSFFPMKTIVRKPQQKHVKNPQTQRMRHIS